MQGAAFLPALGRSGVHDSGKGTADSLPFDGPAEGWASAPEGRRSIMLPGMLGNRTSEQWIAEYAASHQHPVNRLCHTLGIPTILISLAVFVLGFFFHGLWWYALALFVLGWLLQFLGHAFEGKPPEFFRDWRFLFVGVRWWWVKI